VARNDIEVGGLYVAELAHLPFERGYFDIASVIGGGDVLATDGSNYAQASALRHSQQGVAGEFDRVNPQPLRESADYCRARPDTSTASWAINATAARVTSVAKA
jgi:hypothetical protein